MKHINLSSWKGSITDWVKLNYIQGGLSDEYADIANLRLNNLYNYYDASDGKIHATVGIVDLGSLNWLYNSNKYFTIAPGNYIDIKLYPNPSGVNKNLLLAGYTNRTQSECASGVYDKSIGGLNWGGGLIINNFNYTNAATFKNGMSGKMLIYELAEPTIIDPSE